MFDKDRAIDVKRNEAMQAQTSALHDAEDGIRKALEMLETMIAAIKGSVAMHSNPARQAERIRSRLTATVSELDPVLSAVDAAMLRHMRAQTIVMVISLLKPEVTPNE